jgi:hypothetical protein
MRCTPGLLLLYALEAATMNGKGEYHNKEIGKSAPC